MEDEVWLSDIGEHLRDIREYTRSNNEALQRIADKLMLAGVHLPRALSSGLQEPLDAARCTLAEFNKIVCNNFDPTDLVDASINAYIQEEHPEDQHEVADGDGSNLRQLGLAAAKGTH